MWWEPEHKYLPRKVINRSKCGILRKHPQKICSERNLASGNNKKCGQNKQERSVLKHPHSEAGECSVAIVQWLYFYLNAFCSSLASFM